MYMYLCGETVEGKTRQDHSNSTASLPQKIKKQKERKHLGKNNQKESNRNDQKPETKKDGTYQFSRFYFTCMYPYTKTIYLPLSRCLTHARTHAQRPSQKKDSVHPSIHPFFLDYITQRGIPPRHKKSHRARNPGRPISQRERERDSFCLGHITEYDFISPQHASYQHTVLDADAADDENYENDDGYPTIERLHCAASDPIQFSHPSIQL